MRKKIILTVVAAALVASACNTVAGAGRDLQSAGRAVSETARDAAR